MADTTPLELTAEDRKNLSLILRSEAKLQEQLHASLRACDLPPQVPTAMQMIAKLREAEGMGYIVTSANAKPQNEMDLREAVVDVFSQMPFQSMRDLYWQVGDNVGDMPALGMLPPQYQPNMKRGEVIPVYRSEAELRLIRDRNRILSANNEFALCAIGNRQHYIVGDGFKYTISPRDAKNAEDVEAAKECQHIADAWQEINDLPGLESDVMGRADEDGEAIIRRFPDSEGFDHLRAVEPEHLTGKGGDVNDPKYSFGVETAPDDVETRLAYWIVDNPLEDPIPQRVVASKVAHFRLNVKRTAKRGLPTFYPIESNLRRCEDLLASLGHLARARAKIALIRKVTGLTSGVSQALVDKLTNIRATDPTTSEDMNIERMRYGTVLTSSGNVEYEFPNTNLGAGDLIEVLQADLRACASRMYMPEWMLTALADAKYSNAFVVEAPTHKAFRKLQRGLREFFGLCRYGSRASLLWRQLKSMVKKGVLKEGTLERLKIQCEGPKLDARDPAGEVERHEKLIAGGLESIETAQKSMELDPTVEKPLIAKEKQGKLRSVGDMTAVQQLQIAYTMGQIGREAAAANLQIVMGFTSQECEALLPLALAVKRTPDVAGLDGGGDGAPGEGGDNGPPDAGGGPDAGQGNGGGDSAQTPAGDAADALLAKIGKEAGGDAGGATPIPFAEQVVAGMIADVKAKYGEPLPEQWKAVTSELFSVALKEKGLVAGHWLECHNNNPPEVWKLIEHVWTKPTNGFSGVVTASNGVVYHYVNGVRVASHEFEKHVTTLPGKKAPGIISNPDPEQFAHLLHLVSEHFAKGEASEADAKTATVKLLGKFGGGQKEWDALAAKFGFATGGKKSSAVFGAWLVDHMKNGGFDAKQAAAAKQSHDALDFSVEAMKPEDGGPLLQSTSHTGKYDAKMGKPFNPDAAKLKLQTEAAAKAEAAKPLEVPQAAVDALAAPVVKHVEDKAKAGKLGFTELRYDLMKMTPEETAALHKHYGVKEGEWSSAALHDAILAAGGKDGDSQESSEDAFSEVAKVTNAKKAKDDVAPKTNELPAGSEAAADAPIDSEPDAEAAEKIAAEEMKPDAKPEPSLNITVKHTATSGQIKDWGELHHHAAILAGDDAAGYETAMQAVAEHYGLDKAPLHGPIEMKPVTWEETANISPKMHDAPKGGGMGVQAVNALAHIKKGFASGDMPLSEFESVINSIEPESKWAIYKHYGYDEYHTPAEIYYAESHNPDVAAANAEAAPVNSVESYQNNIVISPDVKSVMKIAGGFHFDKVNHIKSVSGGVASKHFNNATKEWTVPGVHKLNPALATAKFTGQAIDDAAAYIKNHAGTHAGLPDAMNFVQAMGEKFPGGHVAFDAAKPSIMEKAGFAGKSLTETLMTPDGLHAVSMGVPSVGSVSGSGPNVQNIAKPKYDPVIAEWSIDKHAKNLADFIDQHESKHFAHLPEASTAATHANAMEIWHAAKDKHGVTGAQEVFKKVGWSLKGEHDDAKVSAQISHYLAQNAKPATPVVAEPTPNSHAAVLADMAKALSHKTKMQQAQAWQHLSQTHGWGAVKAAWEAIGSPTFGEKAKFKSPTATAPSASHFLAKGIKAGQHKEIMQKLKLGSLATTAEALAKLHPDGKIVAAPEKNTHTAYNKVTGAPYQAAGAEPAAAAGKKVGQLYFPPPASPPLAAHLDVPPGDNNYDKHLAVSVAAHAAAKAAEPVAPEVGLGHPDGYKPKGWNPAAETDYTDAYKGKTPDKVNTTWAVHPNQEKQAYGGVVLRNDPATGKTQVLLRKPSGGFDGYSWTFPKGKLKDSAKTHPDAATTALAEVEEETGHTGHIIGTLPGVFKSDGSTTNAFFVMKSAGVDPSKMDSETSDVAWVDLDAAHEKIGETTKASGKARDLAILAAARKYAEEKGGGELTAFNDDTMMKAAGDITDITHAHATNPDAMYGVSGVAAKVKKALAGLHPHAVEQVAAAHGTTGAGLVQHILDHAKANKLAASIPAGIESSAKNAKSVGKGSTGAKSFTHDGEKYSLKDGGSGPYATEQTINETVANKAFDAMGVAVPATTLTSVNGKPAKISAWVEGSDLGDWLKTASSGDKATMKQHLQKDFVAHVLMNNWDVFGKDQDNVKVTPAKLPVYIDNGGAFDISANGTKKGASEGKPFDTDAVSQLNSMRDPNTNSHGAHWYKDITNDEIKKQIAHAYANKSSIVKAMGISPHAATVAARIDSLHEWASTDGKGVPHYAVGDQAHDKGQKIAIYPKHTTYIHYEDKAGKVIRTSSMAPAESAKWLTHTTANGIAGVRYFTSGSYKNFNNALYNKQELTPEQKKQDQNLQEAFAAQPAFKTPITLYHGMYLSKAGLESYTKRLHDKKAVVWSGYQSSSADPNKAHNYAGEGEVGVATLTIKNVTYGALDAASVTQASVGEEEILLNRGVKLRILSITQGKNKYDKTHIVAEQIPYDESENLHEQEIHI